VRQEVEVILDKPKKVSFFMPPDIEAALRATADREDRTITAVLHRALRAYLDPELLKVKDVPSTTKQPPKRRSSR
jgi:hypothetical protein